MLILPLEVEPQHGHLMCWAAVCVALKRYYGHAGPLDQVQFAHSVLGDHVDQVCAPAHALSKAGLNFEAVRHALPLEQVRTLIRSGHPVLACMRHFIGWHLVVIHGIRGDSEMLVADPLHGPSCYRYDDFLHAYIEHYQWSDTFIPARAEPGHPETSATQKT